MANILITIGFIIFITAGTSVECGMFNDWLGDITDMADELDDWAGDIAGEVDDWAGDKTDKLDDWAGDWADKLDDWAGDMADNMNDWADNWSLNTDQWTSNTDEWTDWIDSWMSSDFSWSTSYDYGSSSSSYISSYNSWISWSSSWDVSSWNSYPSSSSSSWYPDWSSDYNSDSWYSWSSHWSSSSPSWSSEWNSWSSSWDQSSMSSYSSWSFSSWYSDSSSDYNSDSWYSWSSHWSSSSSSWSSDWNSWSSSWDQSSWSSSSSSWSSDWDSWSSSWDQSSSSSSFSSSSGYDTTTSTNDGGDNDDDNCVIKVIRELPEEVKTGAVLPEKCGVKHIAKSRTKNKKNKNKSSRIVGGQEIKPNEWPWLVALGAKVGDSYSQFCGGTLIAPGWVMTAAHCVVQLENSCVGKDDFAIIAGEHDLSNPSAHEEIIPVKRVIIHKDYREGSNGVPYNDIALLELSRDASVEKSEIGSACLSKISPSQYSGKSCYVAGWGSTEDASNPYPVIARHVKVNMADKDKCNKEYSDRISDGMVCAGDVGKDSCQGDSGGPLVCLRGKKWSLVGVVSWGDRCAFVNGVYADTNHYTEWIMDVLKAKFETE